MKYTRDGMKHYIQSAYEAIAEKSERGLTKWKVHFNELTLSLYRQQQEFLLCEVGTCNLALREYANGKSTRDVTLNRVKVINKQELPYS